MNRDKRIIGGLCVLALLFSVSRLSHAQTPKPVPTKAGDKKKDEKGSVELSSVNEAALAPYKDRTITVRGIIESYIDGNKNRYRFAMDDGSAAEVVGEFPAMGGTHWTLKARVLSSRDKPQLSEVSKTATASGGGGGGLGKVDPLLLAGGGLILAALVTLGVMSSRNKSERQKQQHEAQLAEERRRSEDAERRAREAEARKASPLGGGGPGNTVVGSGGGAAPSSPFTMVSVGHLEATSGPHAGTKFPVSPGESRVGRDKTRAPQILLDRDAEVSSAHGSVIVRGDGSTVYRDASRNGSYVNGKLVHHAEVPLGNGDKLDIGATSFAVTLRSNAPSASPASPAAPASNARNARNARNAPTIAVQAPVSSAPKPAPPTAIGFGAELEVIEGPETGRRFAITRNETKLGREGADLLLSDETVSRNHATLLVREGRFYLVDPGSTHGTRVEGAALAPGQERELTGSERIEIGKKTALILHRVG